MLNMRLKMPLIVLIIFYIEQVHCKCMIKDSETLRCPTISNLPRDIAAVQVDLESVRTIFIVAESTGNYKQTLEVPTNSFRLIPNLEILTIHNYSVGRLASNTFLNSSIKYISLLSDDIDRINTGTFMNLPEVMEISLNHNLLEIIPKGAIGNLPKLTMLSLSYNEITFIESSALEKLPNLNILHMNNNRIDGIVVHQIISHPEKLEVLLLSDNILTNLNNFTLQRLTNLKELNLGFNKISVIEPKTFDHTPKLEVLVLTHNSLKTVDGDVFPRSGLSSLRSILLDHNHLMFLSSKFFFRMNGLKKITLVGNPWFCPCLFTIERILHENDIEQICQENYVTGARPICVAEDVGVSNCNYKYNDTLSEKYRSYIIDANPVNTSILLQSKNYHNFQYIILCQLTWEH